ncbi:MAG: nucleoside hydrolase, partial [Pirellulales bacterium]|nr:nucleoside hydrolase [Pirellulales bacterium]
MIKILFDTDIGSDIDDALALLLLLHLPDIELVGITTVYGKVDIRAKIAKKILDAAKVSVPVIAGESVPLDSPVPVWHAGTEGYGVLDEVELAAPLEMFGVRSGADDFIVEMIEANRGEITLVALGALTNVAQAITKKPEICHWVKGFYFMGGGVTYPDP